MNMNPRPQSLCTRFRRAAVPALLLCAAAAARPQEAEGSPVSPGGGAGDLRARLEAVRAMRIEAERKAAGLLEEEKAILAQIEGAGKGADPGAAAEGPEPGARKPGDRFVVPVLDMEVPLRWCPPGAFMMGSPFSEDGRSDDETQHAVTLKTGFWIGETEVTQELWKKTMGGNPSSFKSGPDFPVENVSWNDCENMVAKLNEIAPVAGFKWSLPTEAQWEYACRSGTDTPFFWGDALNGDKANCDGKFPFGTTTKGPRRNKTTRVGSYGANAWGVFDMQGNVWEWCADRYGDYPPGHVVDPAGARSGSFRVSRGGSWFNFARHCRAAYRRNGDPGFRFSILGFRLALVPANP